MVVLFTAKQDFMLLFETEWPSEIAIALKKLTTKAYNSQL